MGPMTGRAAGYCAGYGVPGFMNPIPGRGFRGWGQGAGAGPWGYGAGMGSPYGYGPGAAPYSAWGYEAGVRQPYGYGAAVPPWGGYGPYAPYGAPPTQEAELDMLKGQSEYLEDALEGIRKRIEELEAAAQEEE